MFFQLGSKFEMVSFPDCISMGIFWLFSFDNFIIFTIATISAIIVISNREAKIKVAILNGYKVSVIYFMS